jgi:hypothetical protein
VAGYGDINLREGFDGKLPWPENGDVLLKLLNHSDCDGEIDKDDCGPIADRLTQLLPALVNLDYGEETQKFITGLRVAAANHEAVIFS